MSLHVAVLLLGSNIGNKEKNLTTAIDQLKSSGCNILYRTEILESEAVEFDSSNNFCNIATLISMHFSPLTLLRLIKKTEQKMGRMQDSVAIGKYSDRIIDIDIVSFNQISYISKKLQIPHFRHINERQFSKILLKELKDLNIKHNI